MAHSKLCQQSDNSTLKGNIHCFDYEIVITRMLIAAAFKIRIAAGKQKAAKHQIRVHLLYKHNLVPTRAYLCYTHALTNYHGTQPKHTRLIACLFNL